MEPSWVVTLYLTLAVNNSMDTILEILRWLKLNERPTVLLPCGFLLLVASIYPAFTIILSVEAFFGKNTCQLLGLS